MASDEPVFARPLEEIDLADAGDNKHLMLGLKAGGQAVAAMVPAAAAADLALKILDWVSRKTGDAKQSLKRRPLMAHALYFEGGRASDHIVLTADVGAASVSFEVSHAQLVEALAQLKPEPGEPPKAN